MQAIFDHIEATQEREFLLRVAYMEVCIVANHRLRYMSRGL